MDLRPFSLALALALAACAAEPPRASDPAEAAAVQPVAERVDAPQSAEPVEVPPSLERPDASPSEPTRKARASRRGAPLRADWPTLTQRYSHATHAYEFTAGARERATLAGCQLARAELDGSGGGVLLRPERGDEAWIEFPLREEYLFEELMASWNVVTPPGTGFACEVRVGVYDRAIGVPNALPAWNQDRLDEPELRSPWLRLGTWGVVPDTGAITQFDGGRVVVDVFRSPDLWSAWQLRVRAFRTDGASDAPVRLERFHVDVAGRHVDLAYAMREFSGRKFLRGEILNGWGPSAPQPVPRLPVPFRSQRVEDAAIAGKICSPTSVAMVLAYRGVDVPTAEVAARLFDRDYDMYGNWNRAVQGAFTFGVPGYLTRIADWMDANALLAKGQPLVISIAAATGELTGAPYTQTAGHLLVLCGFDENRDALVNDPAAIDAEHGVTKYSWKELEQCWMGHGGVAYVLLPREKDSEAASTPR